MRVFFGECNNILLYTLYTNFMTFVTPIRRLLCDLRVYLYTHFEFVSSNTSKYNGIIFILHCGHAGKHTEAQYPSRNVNTQDGADPLNIKALFYNLFYNFTQNDTSLCNHKMFVLLQRKLVYYITEYFILFLMLSPVIHPKSVISN
jgi:hypothetical protein